MRLAANGRWGRLRVVVGQSRFLERRHLGSLPPERVRFAPSPTGQLHLGGLRTALYNYLLARQTGGQFILRIEDTDQSRLVADSIEGIKRSLSWTGLHFDEGPGEGESLASVYRGAYIQSARLSVYQAWARKLLETDRAYQCYCPRERLEKLREGSEGGAARYDGRCKSLSPLQRAEASSLPFVIRLNVSRAAADLAASTVVVRDAVFGTLAIPPQSIDDAILLKSDGYPTYHLASVVDDHEMQITTVMRGQEWLPSTPLHVLLYQALGWVPPRFVHLPLLLRPDGSKLSKRHGDAFVEHYRSAGHLPSALLNFVALLGWAPPHNVEIMSLDEMIRQFDVRHLNKAGAIVDVDKLDWFNRQHLARLAPTPSEPVGMLRALLDEEVRGNVSDEYLAECIRLLSSRVTFVKDIVDSAPYLFRRPSVPSAEPSEASPQLEILGAHLASSPEWDVTSINGALERGAQALNQKPAQVMNLARAAITGQRMGASLVHTMLLLGRKECLERIFEYARRCNDEAPIRINS